MRLTPFLAALADRILTREPVVRPNLVLWLTSTLSYVVYCGVVGLQVMLGYTPAALAIALFAGMALVSAALYVGIRHGLGPPRDRHLGVSQLLAGIVFMWLAYAVAGPVSGATLTIVSCHVVYAMFGLGPRRVWQIVAGSLLGLAATMVLCSIWQPERYPLGEQVVGFLYTGFVAVLIARLTTLVAKMHARLRAQRHELALALDKVKQLATRDDLTAVHNRRHLTELIRAQQRQHERSGAPMCLALLDIDFFKVVNDTFGHPAGDEVLRRFADAIQQSLRSADVLGRWGGEEFVVLFPITSLEQARAALQRVRDGVRGADFSSVAPEMRITFSAGLVRVGPFEAVQTAIERADRAMYRAKANGRDRVECDVLPSPFLPEPLPP
ncbi:MAG TPA: GGDEF domain-containing protein [Rhizobacter sp.]|nr:GGDEF domain-containing protein [Rhizobacter sp.]